MHFFVLGRNVASVNYSLNIKNKVSESSAVASSVPKVNILGPLLSNKNISGLCNSVDYINYFVNSDEPEKKYQQGVLSHSRMLPNFYLCESQKWSAVL